MQETIKDKPTTNAGALLGMEKPETPAPGSSDERLANYQQERSYLAEAERLRGETQRVQSGLQLISPPKDETQAPETPIQRMERLAKVAKNPRVQAIRKYVEQKYEGQKVPEELLQTETEYMLTQRRASETMRQHAIDELKPIQAAKAQGYKSEDFWNARTMAELWTKQFGQLPMAKGDKSKPFEDGKRPDDIIGPLQAATGHVQPVDNLEDLEKLIKAADERFGDDDLYKEERYANTASFLMTRAPSASIGAHAIAKMTPPEYRDQVLERVWKMADEDQTINNAGGVVKTGLSVLEGIADIGMPMAKAANKYLGIGEDIELDPEQIQFKQALMQTREEADPLVTGNWIQSNFLKAARMYPSMAIMQGAGVSGRMVAGAAGMGRMGQAAGQMAGILASAQPMIYDMEYESLVGEGIDPNMAQGIATISSVAQSLLETIIPEPLRGFDAPYKGTVTQVTKKALANAAKKYAGEWTEEVAQAVTSEIMHEVARSLDANVETQGLGQAFTNAWEEGKEVALPLLMTMGPSMAISGAQTGIQSSYRRAQMDYVKSLREQQLADRKTTAEAQQQKPSKRPDDAPTTPWSDMSDAELEARKTELKESLPKASQNKPKADAVHNEIDWIQKELDNRRGEAVWDAVQGEERAELGKRHIPVEQAVNAPPDQLEARLEALQTIRGEHGNISIDNAREYGIPGNNRGERKENASKELKKIQKELARRKRNEGKASTEESVQPNLEGTQDEVQQQQAEQADVRSQVEQAIEQSQQASQEVQVGKQEEVVPETDKAAQETGQPASGPEFEAFRKEYKEAFTQLMSYPPDQVGSQVYAEKMAELADKHPDWVEQIEAEIETETKDTDGPRLTGEKPETVQSQSQPPADATAESQSQPPAESTVVPPEKRKGRKTRPDPGNSEGAKDSEQEYKAIRDQLTSIQTREQLSNAIPLLRAIYPEYADSDVGDDPWGIRRAIHQGDEVPRIPTVELNKRIREARMAGTLPSESAVPPAKTLVQTPDTTVSQANERPDLTVTGQSKPIPGMESDDASYVVHRRKPDVIPDTFSVVVAGKPNGKGWYTVKGTGMTATEAYDRALQMFNEKKGKASVQPPATATTEATADAKFVQARDKAIEKIKTQLGYSLTPADPKTAEEREVASFLKSRGKQFSFVEGDNRLRGAVDPGDGFILLKRGREPNLLWQTVGHELAHETGLDKSIPADSSVLQAAMDARLKRSEGLPNYDRLKDNPAKLEREARADIVAQFFSDKAFRDRIQRTDPSMWDKIVDAVMDMISKWDGTYVAKSMVLQELQAKRNESRDTKADRKDSRPDGDAYFQKSELDKIGGFKSRDRLVYISPDEFLQLAKQTEPSASKAATVKQLIDQGKPFDDVPYLGFVHDGEGMALVTSHEGRHRAMALKELGITQMPVRLESQSGGQGQPIRWSEQGNEAAFDRLKGEWPNRLISEGGDQFIPFPVGDLRKQTPSPDGKATPSTGSGPVVSEELKEAIRTWKGSPANLKRYLKILSDGGPIEGGNVKEGVELARAFVEGVAKFAKAAPTLYRGDTKDPAQNDSPYLGWTADKAEAERWAKKYGGKVYTKTGAVGLEVKSLGLFDAGESEWIVPHQAQKMAEHPWKGATVEQELQWRGTKVTVAPKGREEGYAGVVERVLNNGDLVEVIPAGAESSFRVPADRITVDEIFDEEVALKQAKEFLAERKRQKQQAADEAKETAKQEKEAKTKTASGTIAESGVKGNATSVITVDGKVRNATYFAIDADILLPSHDARKNFAKNDGSLENERPYHDKQQGAQSRGVVEEISNVNDLQKLTLITSDTKSAIDGPPVVDYQGRVLGGNARAMGMQLAYFKGGNPAAALREHVLSEAAKFGIDQAAVESMNNPVIIRVFEGKYDESTISALLNEPLSAGKSQATISVSQGKRVSEETAQKISNMLNDDTTLREVMADPATSERIIQSLIRDGAWSSREVEQYVDPRTGMLNPTGKEAIEQLLIAKVVPDPTLLGNAMPSVRQKLLAAIGPLVKGMADKKHGKELLSNVLEAVEAHLGYHDAKKSGTTLQSHFMDQGVLVSTAGHGNYAVAGLVHALDTLGPKNFKNAMADLVQALGIGEQTQSLFGELNQTFETIPEAIREVIDPPLKFPATIAAPPAKPPKKSDKLKKEASKLMEEMFAGLDELNQKLLDKKKLNTGFDPELVIDAIKIAEIAVKAGIKTFQGYVQVVIERYGEAFTKNLGYYMEVGWKAMHEEGMVDSPAGRVADYLSSTKVEPEVKGNPQATLGLRIKGLLDSGKVITRDMLFELADEAFGGRRSDNVYGDSQANDALELGVNLYLQGKTNPDVDINEAIANTLMLEALGELLPTHRARTGEKNLMQQFSTPPAYAYAVSWLSGVTKGDVVLEPSAGLGGIAVHAANSGAKVYGNELSEHRADGLKQLNLEGVFTEDAEQIGAILKDKMPAPTLVLMNPPFSRAGKRMGSKMMPGMDRKHIDEVLQLVPDGGRVVAIVGAGLHGQSKSMTEWLKNLPYQVTANIEVARDVYKGYGTQFPTRVLVIDKVPRGDSTTIVETVANLQELIRKGQDARQYRRESGKGLAQSAVKPDLSQDIRGEQDLAGLGADARNPVDGGTTETPSKPSSDRRRGRNRGSGTSDATVAGEQTGDRPGDKHGGGKRGRKTGVRGGKDKRDGSGRSGVVSSGNSGRVPRTGGLTKIPTKSRKKSEQKKRELTASTFENYVPSVEIPGASPHPAPIVESAAMAAVSSPPVTYSPDVMPGVFEGYVNEDGIFVGLSDIQLEAIALAGQAHSQTLPSGERRGFLIGDGTGVGKAREALGIIQDDFIKNGGTAKGRKAIFVTKNDTLVKDAVNEWVGVGGDAADMHSMLNVKMGSEIPFESGVMAVGYDTVKKEPNEKQSDKNIYETRIDQLVKWVGPNFDGVLIFDEAHMMANSLDTESGSGNAAGRALAGIELQQRLPNAKVVYLSATAATEVRNLAYADRLGLWGEGTSFADKKTFIAEIDAGGVAAMEKVASDMKAMGMYIARNLSFDDGTDKGRVEFERITHDLTPDQRSVYNKLSEAWFHVLNNIEKALEITSNTKGKGKIMSAFRRANQQFWNDVITSMTAPALIKSISNDLADGRSVIIQLYTTKGEATKRAINNLKEDQTLDDLDISPRRTLMELVEKSFPTQRFEEYIDENGNVRSRPVLDSEGNPVHDPQALSMKEQLLLEIGLLKVGERSPMDQIIDHFGRDMVAEISGRSERIYIDDDGRKQREPRGKSAIQVDRDAFMNGRKRVLMFTEAGGVGASYHASLAVKNQQRRSHYLWQAGWSAFSAVQGLGRSHRSNQASAPMLHLVEPNIEGFKRFISTIARRLSQLGALTKGERKAGDAGLFSAKDNLESREANTALDQFVNDAIGGQIDGIDKNFLVNRLGFRIPDGGNASRDIKIPTFLNRLLNLPLEEQATVYNAFQQRLDAVVNQALQNGTLDQGMETIKAERIQKTSEQVVHTHEATGAQTKLVELNVTTKATRHSFDEVQAEIAKFPTYRLHGFVQSNTNGAVQAVVDVNRSVQEESGKLSQAAVFIGVKGTSYGKTIEQVGNQRYWKELTRAEARQLWDAEFDKAPSTNEETTYLMTGALLPVWNKINVGGVQVRRALTDDGETILGRVIPERYLDATLRDLGIKREGKERSYTPQEAMQAIYEGATAVLNNGWKVQVRKVDGEDNVEIIGPSVNNLEAIKQAGGFVRMIDYRTRVFLPFSDIEGNSLGILAQSNPIIRIDKPKRSATQAGDRSQVHNVRRSSDVGQSSRADFASTPPETAAGKKIAKLMDKDSERRKVGPRTIINFVMDLARAASIQGKSQLSRRAPGHYRPKEHLIRSRTGASGIIDLHEGGHAFDYLLRDHKPEFLAHLEQELIDIAIAPNSFASAKTPAEGFAEFFRRYITDYQSIPEEVRADIEKAIENTSPELYAGLRDAHRLWQQFLARPIEERLDADKNDRSKRRGRHGGKDLAYLGLYNLFGGDVAIHKLRRKFEIPIYQFSKALGDHFRAMTNDTKADPENAFDSMIRVATEVQRTIFGDSQSTRQGVRVIANKEMISDEDVTELRLGGFDVPDAAEFRQGEPVFLTNQSFDSIRQRLGTNWSKFENMGQIKSSLERLKKKGHDAPWLHNNLTVDQAQEFVDKMEADHPEWVGMFNEVREYFDGLLLIGVLSGEYSTTEAVRIRNAWEDYWPLIRQQTPEDKQRGGAGVEPTVGVHRAFGSALPFRTLMEAVQFRTKAAYQAYYQNRLRLAVKSYAAEIQKLEGIPLDLQKEAARVMFPINLDMKRVAKMTPGEMASVVADYLNAETEKNNDLTPDQKKDLHVSISDIDITMPGKNIYRGKRPGAIQVVGVHERGRLQFYQITDPIVFDLLSHIPDSGISRSWLGNFFVRGIQPWKNSLVEFPFFATRNIPRDQMTAMLNGDTIKSLIPGYYLARGAGFRWSQQYKDDTPLRMERIGRGIDNLYSKTHTNFLRRYMQAMADAATEGIYVDGYRDMSWYERSTYASQQVVSTLLWPVTMFNFFTGGKYMSALSEQTPRDGAFIDARARGMSYEYAMRQAGQITGKFSQRQPKQAMSTWVRAAGFLNPGLQINWGHLKRWSDPDPRKQQLHRMQVLTMPALFAVIAATNLALILAYYKDDELEDVLNDLRERPEYDRDTTMPIMGKFRMPYEQGPIGAIAAFAFNSTQDWLIGDTTRGIDDRLNAFVKKVQQMPGPTDALMPHLKAAMELKMGDAGYSFYRDRSIVPEHLIVQYPQNPELRKYDDTPSWAAWLGKKMNVSPIKVEYAVAQSLTTTMNELITAGGKLLSEDELAIEDFPGIRRMKQQPAIGFRSDSVQQLRKISQEVAGLSKKIANESSPKERERLAEAFKRLHHAALAYDVVADIYDDIDAEVEKDSIDKEAVSKAERKMTVFARQFLLFHEGKAPEPPMLIDAKKEHAQRLAYKITAPSYSGDIKTEAELYGLDRERLIYAIVDHWDNSFGGSEELKQGQWRMKPSVEARMGLINQAFNER